MSSDSQGMTQLNQFYEQVRQRGVLATNQFRLSLMAPEKLTHTLPTSLLSDLQKINGSSNSSGSYDLAVWLKSAQLPTKTIDVAEMNYQGLKVQVPTLTNLSTDINLEFVSDSSFLLYNMLSKWCDIISHTDVDAGAGRIGMWESHSDVHAKYHAHGGFKGVWDSKLRLEVFKKDHLSCLQSFIMEGAFPVKIGEITFSNDSAELATFTTEWKYNYWYIGTEAESTRRGVNANINNNGNPF